MWPTVFSGVPMPNRSAHPTKKKGPAISRKALIHNEEVWLPDLGSNQGPTD